MNFGASDEYGRTIKWRYRDLREPALSRELERMAGATNYLDGRTDAVTFQPCCNEEESSQDRYTVQEWGFGDDGKKWRFVGLFDGHAGPEMADHAVSKLPPRMQAALGSYLETHPLEKGIDVDAISALIQRTISEFDDAALSDLLALFNAASPTPLPEPSASARDPLAHAIAAATAELRPLSDAKIKFIINDPAKQPVVVRSMRGTTALVSLVDPDAQHVWVASVGDCQAALGKRMDGEKWSVEILSANHNGNNPREEQRVRDAHPGEPECMLRNRVLGSIAVTRAIGDHLYRLPRVWTERVFLECAEGFRTHTVVRDFIVRNMTPPYLSNVAEMRHAELGRGENVLVMCSDGLTDLYYADQNELQKTAKEWFSVLDRRKEANAALRLLREGLGGNDRERVAQMMTVEMFERWMDDTTVIVQRL
ncbi:protein serine/threonine phosphatase 2C [Dentipellis sp. KUC8613]|nr:protein serine/threonine phosphatase 2C [Dentipellis sp. KUC8613]